MKKVVSKPNIQEYHDYLEFLKDWIEYLKVTDKDFSLRKVAAEARMASGYLPMCLSRKRKFSEKFYQKVKPFLKLSAKEEKYMDLLRIVAESEDPKARVNALSNLQKLKDYRESNRSELEVHQYLSKWFYVAIREMVKMPDFKNDISWIQEQLRGRVSQKEISEALEFLTRFEFIQQNNSGEFYVKEKQLTCDEGVYKLSLGEFHRQMLDWAKISIEETPRAERLLMGHTATLTKDSFLKIQEILKETVQKIEGVGNSSHPHEMEVYHIELAAFPLTKKKSPSSGNMGE